MRLENGQEFPHLEAEAIGEANIKLPAELAGEWGVVLFYRGHF